MQHLIGNWESHRPKALAHTVDMLNATGGL